MSLIRNHVRAVAVLVFAVAAVAIYFVIGGSGSGTSGPQLSAGKLKAALLPASYFQFGLTWKPVTVGTQPTTTDLSTITCQYLLDQYVPPSFADQTITAMDPGATAAVRETGNSTDSSGSFGRIYGQGIEQFESVSTAQTIMHHYRTVLSDCSGHEVSFFSVQVTTLKPGVGDEGIGVDLTAAGRNPEILVDFVRKGQDIYGITLGETGALSLSGSDRSMKQLLGYLFASVASQ